MDIRELQKLYGGLGQFSLSKRFLYDAPPGVIQAIMFGLIVISAEHYWEGDRIMYRGFHPDFKEIEIGAMAPEYDAVVHQEPAVNDPEIIHYRVEWVPAYGHQN